MKQGKSDIVLILDKSGSMGPIAGDTIGTVNTFIEDQRKVPGEATLAIVPFSSPRPTEFERKPMNQVESLTAKTYRPDGMTALYDTIEWVIDRVGEQLKNTPEEERPEHVLIAIITDGEENRSTKATRAGVMAKIEHQKTVYKWNFMFLGVGIDAYKEAAKIGIARSETMSVSHDASGMEEGVKAMSFCTQSMRQGGSSKFEQ